MTYEDIIDAETAKERFMGNYGMFTMYLYQFAEGRLYGELQSALKIGDVEHAFEIAHDLKGVILNLSLKPAEQPIFEIVEKLRDGELPTEAEWSTFADAYALTTEWIEKMKAENVKLF